MGKFVTKHKVKQKDCYIVWSTISGEAVFAATHFGDIEKVFPNLFVKKDQLDNNGISSFTYQTLDDFVRGFGKRRLNTMVKGIFPNGVLSKENFSKGNTLSLEDFSFYGKDLIDPEQSIAIIITEGTVKNYFIKTLIDRWELCAIVKPQ